MQTARARNEVIGLENVSLFYPSKTAEVLGRPACLDM
jgi:hypothetical protein